MSSLPSGRVSLEKHPRVLCVGDVHGDLNALLGVLQFAGLVSVPDDVKRIAEECPTTPQDRMRNPLSRDQMSSVKWTGGNNAVLFLGDVLDNRRGHRDDPFGVCGYAGTQTQMMQLLLQLRQQASGKGGKVMWVLGNHDVGNVIKEENHWFCTGYAPQHHTLPNSDEVYETCDSSGFSQEHRDHVRGVMREMRCVPIIQIHGGGHSVIALHGGITPKAMQLFSSTQVGPYQIEAGDPVGNIRQMNRLYYDAIHREDETALRILSKYSKHTPTWCRPKKVEDPALMREYFGTSRMCKAHDIQERGANCSAGGSRRRLTGGHTLMDAEMGDVDLCRIDVGMSRCFAKYVPRRRITYLALELREGRLFREIHEKHLHN